MAPPMARKSRSHQHLSPDAHRNVSRANETAVDSDDDSENTLLARVPSRPSTADVSLVGSYRRPSFTFGQSRPTFVPACPLPTAIDTLTATERETMLEQERELLKDSAGIRDYGTGRERRSSDAGSVASLESPVFPRLIDESTGLLRTNTASSSWEYAVDAGIIHTTYWREAKVIAKSAPQLYITFALQYSLTIASIFAAGRLGKNELAGVSLGSMTATITGYAVYQGLSSLGHQP
jgi:MATE family multidrug resistance protein